MTSSTFTKTQQRLDASHRNELDFENYDDYEKYDDNDDVDVDTNRSNIQEEDEKGDDQYSSDCSRSTSNLGDFFFRTFIITYILSI